MSMVHNRLCSSSYFANYLNGDYQLKEVASLNKHKANLFLKFKPSLTRNMKIMINQFDEEKY